MDKQKIQPLLEGAVAAAGYELWGFEWHSQGQSGLLRVYIDKPDGVNVDDCEKASRQISALLDVEDPISHGYRLEVSSLGIEVPLFKLEHYQKFLGEIIKLKLRWKKHERKNYVGHLVQANDDGIELEAEGSRFHFEWNEIARANLKVDI
jgi:ribosome maturation factor RimP